MRVAGIFIVVGCAVSWSAAAHGAPMTRAVEKPASSRSELLAEIATEERAIAALLAEIAQLETRRALVERRAGRLRAASRAVLPVLGADATEAQSSALAALLKKELESVGIPLAPEQEAGLVRAMSKGDEVGMMLALWIMLQITEATVPSAIETADAEARKAAASRRATRMNRLAAATASQAPIAPATVAPMLDEMTNAPGAVPVSRAELTPSAKPATMRAGDHVLVVATKSHATYVANLTASIDAAKSNVAERRRRIAALRQRLDALGPDKASLPARVVRP
jgi:hypothetical protein